jgi:hypothetical protein
MAVRPAGKSETGSAPAVLASVPWVVVLLGAGLLTTLLILALLSFRGREQPAPPPPPALPMYLPTMPAITPSATDAPLAATAPTASPSGSATPSPRATSRRPTPSASTTRRPDAASSGSLGARYQVTESDRNSFEASLTVSNGSGRAQDWRVELLFTGNVKGIQASSASGVSVTSQGNGWYVLRGTSPLGAGDSTTVDLRFSRSGTGDRPGQCTVNGADCVIG